MSKVVVNNGLKTKRIPSSEVKNYTDNGWVVGGLPTTSGHVWINKDGKNKTIKKDKLSEYLADGWTKGKIPSNKELNVLRVHKDGITKSIQKRDLDSYLANGWTKGVAYKYRWITNDIEERWTDIELPEGWKLGRLYKNPEEIISVYNDTEVLQIKKVELHKYEELGYKFGKGREFGLCDSSTKDTMWIHKNSEVKLIKQSDFPKYLKNNWHAGQNSNNKELVIVKNEKLKIVSKDEFYSVYRDWSIAKSGDLNGMSTKELYFAALLQKNNLKYTYNYRLESEDKFYVYDFMVNGILIEINDSYTHSTNSNRYNNGLSKDYHYNKTKFARDLNFNCINIWDWDNLDLVIDYLKGKVCLANCSIRELEHSIELLCKDTLVSTISFNDELIISNYFPICDMSILIDYLLDRLKPKSMSIYCDLSKCCSDYTDTFIKRHLIIRGEHVIDETNYNLNFNNYSKQETDCLEIFDCGHSIYRKEF